MKRSTARFQAFVQAGLRRLGTQIRRALLTDEDVLGDTGEAERVEARHFAERAGALRGGMAKVAQLQAYLEGPGAAVDVEAREALSTLWDRVPGADPEAIRNVIKEDLGAYPEDLFVNWKDQPIAAASLGQVHAAEARDGTKLAVKVQYPGVADGLRDDLESRALLKRLAGSAVGGALSDEAIEALRKGILEELDYRSEAANLGGFRSAWPNDPEIVIPRPYPALSSTRVLSMDRLEGESLAAFRARAGDAQRSAIARVLFRFAVASPVVHGLLNADPNPGNYLVLDASAEHPRVGFLDFGCAIEIEDKLYDADRKLWLSLIHRDGEALRNAALDEGLIADMKVLDTSTFRAWEQAFAEPFLRRGDFTLSSDRVHQLGELTSRLVRARGMALPAGPLLLWRQRLGVLSVIASLHPTFDFRLALANILDDKRNPIPLYERYP